MTYIYARRMQALGKAERQRLLAGIVARKRVGTQLELAVALASGARIVGVNSRDLDTFEIDTRRAWDILRGVPATVLVVAESGMATPGDVEAAAAAGADAVLVGTALSASARPGGLLGTLTRTPRHGR